MHVADQFIARAVGPFASVRCCKLCGFKVSFPTKGRLRNPGQGHGMREGNKARGAMIQHIKTAHADRLRAVVRRIERLPKLEQMTCDATPSDA